MNIYGKVSDTEKALLRLSAREGLCYATIRMIPSITVESVSRIFPAIWVGDTNKSIFKAVSMTEWIPYEDSGIKNSDIKENDINLYDVVPYGEQCMLKDLFEKGGIYASVEKSPLTGNLYVVAVSISGDWPTKDKLLLFKATSATEWKEVMSDEKVYTT